MNFDLPEDDTALQDSVSRWAALLPSTGASWRQRPGSAQRTGARWRRWAGWPCRLPKLAAWAAAL
jgi:hypothetical protein